MSAARARTALPLALAALAAAPAVAQAEALTAAPASDFRDSVGVQTHHSFVGYAADRSPQTTTARLLRTLGVFHVRDNVCLSPDSECVRPRQRMADLKDALGPGQPDVKFMLLITRELETHPDRAERDADIERALTAVSQPPLAGLVSGIESVNEPDLQKTPDWPQRTLADEVTIRRLLAEPRFASLRSLPLLTPSMGHPRNTGPLLSAGWTGLNPATPNFHPYPPAWGGPERGLDAPCIEGATVLDCVKKLAPAKAPIATESGYTTNGDPQSTSWVSREAQAVYLPRLLLENFSNGVARTYIYELVDLSPDSTSSTNGFGLYRSTFGPEGWTVVSSTAKPAAHALQRLNERIGDAGAIRKTGVLNIDLRGPDGKILDRETVRRVLLRRRDGSYVLALWQPKVVWNNTSFKQRTIEVDPIKVETKINSSVWGGFTATAFRPSVDQYATRVTGTKKFVVDVDADVTLIDLRQTWGGQGRVPGGPVEIRPAK